MTTRNISEFKNGWFIGDFKPTIVSTNNFEVAHHFYKSGFCGVPHTHKIATEYNYIVRGKLEASGKILNSGDIFIYHPNEVSSVKFLEDTDLVIVKTPSIPSDKYEV